MMDQRGLLDRFLAVSEKFQVGGLFGGIMKPWPDRLDTAHPYGLSTLQLPPSGCSTSVRSNSVPRSGAAAKWSG